MKKVFVIHYFIINYQSLADVLRGNVKIYSLIFEDLR